MCLLAAGCGPKSRPDITPIALRFIEQDATELLEPENLCRKESIFRWGFRTRQDMSLWRLGLATKAFPEDQEFAQINSLRRRPRLYRRDPIDPTEVDLITLVAHGIRYEAYLFWSTKREPFNDKRSLRAESPNMSLDDPKTYRFLVANHELWKDSIERVFLQITALPEQKFYLHELEGFKLVVDPDRLKEAATHPWKVDIENDVRTALVTIPGDRIERELTVPDNAHLLFAYGFRRGPIVVRESEPIRYRASLKRAGDENAEPVVLLEGEIDHTGTAAAARRWRDERIDLASYAGQKVTLTLETLPNESWSARHGVPVWASPEILVKEKRSEPDAPVRSPANVVVIAIDSLRADRLSLHGYGRPTTPEIDAWAERRGVAFANAITQATSSRPAQVSILSGLEALDHGVTAAEAPASLTMLPEALRAAGYTTLGVMGDPELGAAAGMAQGFDRFVLWPGSRQLEARIVFDTTLHWLAQNADRPFFLFVQTAEVGAPYHLRQPYAAEFGVEDQESDDGSTNEVPFLDWEATVKTDSNGVRRKRRLRVPDRSQPYDDEVSTAQAELLSAVYDSGVRYADEHVGRLLAALDELDLANDTLVVLTSAHGESLGEHDRLGPGFLYEENVRVPLIFVFPRRLTEPRIEATQVRSIDIAPTVLDLLGLPPLADAEGVSLAALLENAGQPRTLDAWSYASTTGAGLSLRRADRSKYVLSDSPWKPEREAEAFYRLDTDAIEARNVAADEPEVSALRERARAKLRARRGLRLRFENPSAVRLTGAFRGPTLTHRRIKSVDLPCDCLTWEGKRAVFEVPPGVAYTLFVVDAATDALSFTFGAGDRKDLEWDVQPRSLTEPVTRTFEDGGARVSLRIGWE